MICHTLFSLLKSAFYKPIIERVTLIHGSIVSEGKFAVGSDWDFGWDVLEGASDVVGEQTSKTQPIPLWPLPFVKQTFTEKDVNEWASNKDEIIAELRLDAKGILAQIQAYLS